MTLPKNKDNRWFTVPDGIGGRKAIRTIAISPTLLGFLSFILLVSSCMIPAQTSNASEGGAKMYLVCSPQNNFYSLLLEAGYPCDRFDTPMEATAKIPDGSPLMVLATDYPAKTTELSQDFFDQALKKSLRLYLEFPSYIPDVTLGAVQSTHWERAIVSSEEFAPAVPNLQILCIHDCHFVPAEVTDPLIVVGRVAGYDKAVFGLPSPAYPILFRIPERNILVSTTCLSQFVTGRYAPSEEWRAVWQRILSIMDTSPHDIQLAYLPSVRTQYGPADVLPADSEKRGLDNMVKWIHNSRLLLPPSRKEQIHQLLAANAETIEVPDGDAPVGDGSLGILEGYAATILSDGNQVQRLPIRNDCQNESAMVLALGWALNGEGRDKQVAENLLDFVYFNSDMHTGVRGNPAHPSFGLMAWGTISPSWTIANYSDDNARSLLGSILAASAMKNDRWNESILRALLANLRVCSPEGFYGPGGRIDIGPLEKNGWKYYHDTSRVLYSPHYESYMWACYLWAYRQTGVEEFLDKARNAISMTMKVYPDQWLWKDSIERARMILCLSWLVRVDDTPEHRGWLKRVAEDLLENQQTCGAIEERIVLSGPGHFVAPECNEAYGTREIPLIQENGDPCSDQLYTTGFALFGLHEAVAATGDADLKAAEDKLAEYLCRIQIYSEKYPYLSGTWFRAFDYRRWEPWASSGDLGWGAWSIEAGWCQAWTAAILGLRTMNASMWDYTSELDVRKHLDKVQAQMSIGDGLPWRKE